MGNEIPQQGDSQKLRALIVDDEDSILQLVAMALRYDGWDVETAASGAEGLEKIRSFNPDVAVLDIMLPDFDGVQLLSRIRGEGYLVPILFLTALDSVDDRVNGLTARADHYILN